MFNYRYVLVSYYHHANKEQVHSLYHFIYLISVQMSKL